MGAIPFAPPGGIDGSATPENLVRFGQQRIFAIQSKREASPRKASHWPGWLDQELGQPAKRASIRLRAANGYHDCGAFSLLGAVFR